MLTQKYRRQRSKRCTGNLLNFPRLTQMITITGQNYLQHTELYIVNIMQYDLMVMNDYD